MNKKISVTALWVLLFAGLLCESGAAFGPAVRAEESQSKIADVYLIGGQSNAAGIAPVAGVTPPQTDKVMFYGDGGMNNRPFGDPIHFVPVAMGFGENINLFGPEVGLAGVLQAQKADRDNFIVKYAWGDTDIFADWRSPSLGGTIGGKYESFVQTVHTGLDVLTAQGYTINLCGLAWMQGEKDAISKEKAIAYTQNLMNLITDLRAEFDTDFPVVIGKINEDIHLMPYNRIVILAQQAAANAMDGVYFMDTSELRMKGNDPWHYDGESMLKLGAKFGEMLIR